MHTDREMLDWVIANLTYMEHRVKGVHPRDVKMGGYWPQMATDLGMSDSQLIDLSLRDYIESQMP